MNPMRDSEYTVINIWCPSQACRQYNVLVKDMHENKVEDWVSKSLKFQDSSGSSSSSEDAKKRSSKASKKA